MVVKSMVEFHVLRCAHCQTFQVQQVTKAKKWKCKLCGEKQSVLKEYGRGTGADCRRHVQKLNSLRGEMEIAAANTRLDSAYHGSIISSSSMEKSDRTEQQGKSGYWDTFMEKETRDESDEDEDAKSERGGENDDGIFATTDWSTLQNERRQNWKKRKELYRNSNRWNKRARYEGSSPPSDENIPSRNKSQQISKNYGKDLYRDNSFSTIYNQTASTKSFVNGYHSIDSFTTTTATANSFVKNSPSVSCGKRELSLKTGLKDCFDDCHTKEHASHESIFDSLSYSSSPVMTKSSHKKTSAPLKSSKWSLFVTTNVASYENDNSDDNSMPDNADYTPLLPSSERAHKPNSSILPATATSSKWSTFLNNDEEEEGNNSEGGSGHNYFTPQNNIDSDVNDKTASVEDINPPFIDRSDVGRKSFLFQLGDVDETWDLDL